MRLIRLRLPRFTHLSYAGRGFLVFALALLVACSDAWRPAPPDPPAATATDAPTATPAPSSTHASTLAPTQTLTPTPVPCRATAGTVKREELLSPYLKKPLDYRVYYPPCYDASGATRYPVLYMLHGQTFNDDQWVRLGLTAAADRLIVAGEIQPLLIVMPYEVNTFEDPYLDGYADALVETLLPWIDAFYPACAARECRAVGGLSRGGAYAFLLALDHPDLFGEAGGHSMVPFGGFQNRLNKQLKALGDNQLPRLTIDVGKNDIYLPDLRKYEELLTQLDVPHEFSVNPGNHDEDYWSSHVEEYLRWYDAAFPQE